MNTSKPTFSLRASWVFPVDAPPIRDGVVTVAGERIASVGNAASWSRATPAGELIDLGHVAILPGLVNAHVHLEFSDLTEPLGEPGMAFPAWIRRVIEFRRRVADQPRDSMALGLAECARCGTTTLGEIATSGWTARPITAVPLDGTALLELIGFAPDRVGPLTALARAYVERLRTNRSPWRPGISPHAPYTAHPDLVTAAARLSADAGVPLAMHLAESREELDLLRRGDGPLRHLLVELGVWDSTVIPPGTRPLDYLRRLAPAHRSLVIHGNYLDDDEIAYLAEHAGSTSVVYCPRTHAYFRHEPYPLAKMLAAGVAVALGTDSRASNPDLNLLADMRQVAERHGDVPLETVLSLGTRCGAKALGLEDRVGTLTPGKDANLAVVALPDADATSSSDRHELILRHDTEIVATLYRGRSTFASDARLLRG